jgi:competence protein ComEC
MVLPWLVSGWLLGIFLEPILQLALWQWIVLAAVAAAAALASRRESKLAWSFAAVALLFLGALRASVAERQRSEASIVGFVRTAELVDVRGTVLAAPAPWGEAYSFLLKAQAVSVPGSASEARTDGVVLVLSRDRPDVPRLSTAVVRGALRPATAFEAGRSSAVLEASTSRMLVAPPRLNPVVVLDMLRGRIVARLHRVLPAAEASLVAGVLLGADETMPADVRQAFRDTGTAHILAVSGFNVTIVAAAAAAFFGSILGARRGSAAAGAAVLLYTLLCGAGPAVVRAALMAGLALVALRLGRQSAALASLAAAALLMTLLDPGVVHDVGFQLSFLATLGLVLAGRPCQEVIRRWGEQIIRPEAARAPVILIVELAALSLVAQLATLPLSAFVFHRLPLAALPANALILPAQPLLMAAGAATAAAALISVQLGLAVAWLAWVPAVFTLRVAHIFAALPGASLALDPFPVEGLLLAYAALVAGFLAARRPEARSLVSGAVRRGGPAWLLAAMALAGGAWKAASETPDGRLHVTAFPGGEVLIESPTGRFLAISPGASGDSLRASLEGHLPLSHRRLDWIILTDREASAEAFLGSLALQDDPRLLMTNGSGVAGSEASVSVSGREGSAFELGDGSALEVVPAAGGSIEIQITYGSARWIVGVCQSPFPCARTNRAPAQAVILIGDGRAVSQSLQAGFRDLDPWVVVAAPLPGDRLTAACGGGPPPCLAAPELGWIHLATDGVQMEAHAERPP